MKKLHYLILSILFLSSCDKFDWNNPYDPECPKELFTPSSPGATMEGNSVKLTWSQQNDDISGFALFRSAEGESISNLTQTQKSTTQFIDANITPGKKYTYYVVAVAGTNKSDTVKAEIIPVIPITISTGAVTELAATSAKVSGNITNAGGGTVTSRGICWSTTPSPTVSSSKTTEGTGAGLFTSTLTSLLAGTTYYARAYGENSRGISYGTEISFTTLGPPKLTTTAVSNITATTATSGGTIISDGGSPITAKGVVWSTTPNPTITLTTKTDDGTGVGSFTSTMSNLTNSTKYFFRAYAANLVGVSYGEEQSFIVNDSITAKLKNGLIAFYPFNGNAIDESGNGNNGVVNGAILSTDRFGNLNRAYQFVSEHTITGNCTNFPAANSARTISFWYQSSQIGILDPAVELMQVMGYGGGSCGQSFIMYFTNSKIDVQGHCAAFLTQANLNYATPNSNWHNVIVTYEGGVLKIHLDGIYIQGKSGVTLNTNTSGKIFCFGREVGNSGSDVLDYIIPQKSFNGKLDDFRFYNRALTQEEITYLANN